MTINDFTFTKAILTRSKDWKKWFWKLRSNVSHEIWPYINLEGDEINLFEAPPTAKAKAVRPTIAYIYESLSSLVKDL